MPAAAAAFAMIWTRLEFGVTLVITVCRRPLNRVWLGYPCERLRFARVTCAAERLFKYHELAAQSLSE